MYFLSRVVMSQAQLSYYLGWWILYGYLLRTVLCSNMGQYRAKPFESGKELVVSGFGPILTNKSLSSTFLHLQDSSFSPLPNNLVSCEDLEGVGSFDTTCFINSNVYVNRDVYVLGAGNLEILPHVAIVCPIAGCSLKFNLSGNIKVGHDAAIIAGAVEISAVGLSLGLNSSINTTALGGPAPSQTSGTPVGYDGGGGGHGGRGASCLKTNETSLWGGDVYCWRTLSWPRCYGSNGGGTSDQHKLGGNGGGRVLLNIKDLLTLNGSVTAEGGDGGIEGGGGSGGSIIIHSQKL